MATRRLPPSALAGLIAAGALGVSAAAPGEESQVRSDLGIVARRSVFFGHQSVGQNVLDGLGALAAAEGISLRIRDVSAAPEAPPATLAHAFVATNGDPAAKLAAFAHALDAMPAPGPDLALVKLCWADISASTDVKALFARYQATLAELEARHPATTFVHVTTPLTGVQGGPKALVKKLLGRTPWGLAENARREEYNALLRAAYAGRAPLFDLAAVESTEEDGARTTEHWGEKAIPTLAPAYTDDGGHLNAAGQRRAARALLEVLARAPARRAASGQEAAQ